MNPAPDHPLKRERETERGTMPVIQGLEEAQAERIHTQTDSILFRSSPQADLSRIERFHTNNYADFFGRFIPVNCILLAGFGAPLQ